MSELISIKFHKAGLLTTVQDLGRNGYQSFGVPISGVMDENSAKIANWLVGNEENSPLVEMTLLGPKIEFGGEVQIALTVADLSPKINGLEVSMYETITLKMGDILTFGRLKSGCRTYLAIRGNLQIQKWLNSASASPQNTLKLTPDSLIQKGSELQTLSQKLIAKRIYPIEKRPIFSNFETIKVLAGPEFEQFSKIEIAHFFGYNHIITSDSNRMGYRLDNQMINEGKRDIISSGIVPGTIQVTNSGQPIILMKDAQTSGGYFRFLNVINEDLNKLGQMKPGDLIRFEMVN